MKTQNIKTAKTRKLAKQVLFSAVVFLFSLKSYAADYYWVGGTGNWSDFANHWATSSGGTTFHIQPPTPLDDVYIDANSFLSATDTIKLDITNAFCENFNWQNVIPGSKFTSWTTDKLSVFGSVAIDASSIMFFQGIISFESSNSGNIVSIQDSLNCNLEFNSPAGEWELTNPLAIQKDIRLIAGTLNTNNFPVTCGNFISNYGTPNRALLSGTSEFKIKSYDEYNSQGVPTHSWDIDSTLIFDGTNNILYFEGKLDPDTGLFSSIGHTWFYFYSGSQNYKAIHCNAFGYVNTSLGGYTGEGWFYSEFDRSTIPILTFSNFRSAFINAEIYFGSDSVTTTASLTPILSIGSNDSIEVDFVESPQVQISYGVITNIKKISASVEFFASHNSNSSYFNNSHIFDYVFAGGSFNESNATFQGINPPIYLKCVIMGDAIFNGHNCIFDTLMFNPGATCTINAGDTITINNQFIAFGAPANYIQINSSSPGTQSNIQFNQGNVCSDYLFLRDMNAIGTNVIAGANSLNISNNTGWQFSACSVVSDVWPGDANYDLTANNNDVLNIGLAYGETGPVRAGASNAWVAQPGTDWSSFFQSAINKKHADCDGNGVVDNNDTLAISLNYGLTHPARLANPNSNLSISSPQLYLVANPDTVMEGDTVEVEIYLGTQSIPVDSIYGIAFTINFDTALVDTSWMPFDFTGSWMGTPGVDLLAFDHKLFSEGKADVALTRTDHANIGGYGYIGKMGAVIVDNVGTRLTTAPPYVTLPLSVSNVTALTATEFYLTISTGAENVEIDTSGITGIHQHLNDAPLSVYPNPVRTKLNVFSYWLKGETSCTVELYNVMGEKIISKQAAVSQNRFSIDVSTIPQDMYFIKVITAKGTVNKKILVVKK